MQKTGMGIRSLVFCVNRSFFKRAKQRQSDSLFLKSKSLFCLEARAQRSCPFLFKEKWEQFPLGALFQRATRATRAKEQRAKERKSEEQKSE